MPLPDLLGPEHARTRLPVGATVLYLAAASTERVAVVLGNDPDGRCLLSTRRHGTCRVEKVRVQNVRLAGTDDSRWRAADTDVPRVAGSTPQGALELAAP